ncbi:MAG: SIS domain-containing protein [Clostridia bacterium]|nr:SIS domain-containing protein [Clostridia bacterium]
MSKQNGEITYREIYSQPGAFRAVLDTLPQARATLDKVFEERYDELIFTGCGTSLYLAQTAAYVFSLYNATPAKAVCCSELYYAPDAYIKGRTLVLPMTRKSVTSEVRMAIDRVRQLERVRTLAITCDAGSAEYNDDILLCPGIDEKSIIMTSSFTAMVLMAQIVALHAAGRTEALEALSAVPALADRAIPQMDQLAERIVRENPALDLYVTLGQGAYYGIASESMNKMKEMGLTNSEAYYTLEYRHGPMSLVTDKTLIVLLPSPETAEADAALLRQMEGYGAVTASLGEAADRVGGRYVLPIEGGLMDVLPVAVIFSQLLGYHIALHKDIDPDAPRHLSLAIVLDQQGSRKA